MGARAYLMPYNACLRYAMGKNETAVRVISRRKYNRFKQPYPFFPERCLMMRDAQLLVHL